MKTEFEVEIDEDVLSDFEDYCKETNQNRDAVMEQLLICYIIGRMSNAKSENTIS